MSIPISKKSPNSVSSAICSQFAELKSQWANLREPMRNASRAATVAPNNHRGCSLKSSECVPLEELLTTPDISADSIIVYSVAVDPAVASSSM